MSSMTIPWIWPRRCMWISCWRHCWRGNDPLGRGQNADHAWEGGRGSPILRIPQTAEVKKNTKNWGIEKSWCGVPTNIVPKTYSDSSVSQSAIPKWCAWLLDCTSLMIARSLPPPPLRVEAVRVWWNGPSPEHHFCRRRCSRTACSCPIAQHGPAWPNTAQHGPSMLNQLASHILPEGLFKGIGPRVTWITVGGFIFFGAPWPQHGTPDRKELPCKCGSNKSFG